jgi:hypothetical protein
MTPQGHSAREQYVSSAMRAAGIQPSSDDVAALCEAYTELLAMTRILVDMLDKETSPSSAVTAARDRERTSAPSRRASL